jgi:hypothetical protein
MIRVNIGCGQSPTPSWKNFDNSLTVRIAKSSLLTYLLIWGFWMKIKEGLLK